MPWYGRCDVTRQEVLLNIIKSYLPPAIRCCEDSGMEARALSEASGITGAALAAGSPGRGACRSSPLRPGQQRALAASENAFALWDLWHACGLPCQSTNSETGNRCWSSAAWLKRVSQAYGEIPSVAQVTYSSDIGQLAFWPVEGW